MLCLLGEFGFLPGEVEDVDGGFAFCIDEGYFDVALVGAEGEGDLTEKTGNILGDNLEQRGVGGGLGIELEAGGDFNLEVRGVIQVAAGFEELLDGDLLRDDVVEVGEEAVFLAGLSSRV